MVVRQIEVKDITERIPELFGVDEDWTEFNVRPYNRLVILKHSTQDRGFVFGSEGHSGNSFERQIRDAALSMGKDGYEILEYKRDNMAGFMFGRRVE